MTTFYKLTAHHSETNELINRAYAMGRYDRELWADRENAQAIADYLQSDVGDVVHAGIVYEVIDEVIDIPSGIYFLHVDGGGWVAACIVSGKVTRETEESLTSTHNAACDAWAGITPELCQTSSVDGDLQIAIVRLVMGDETDYTKVEIDKIDV